MAMTDNEVRELSNGHLLGKIAEESAEVIQAAMKMQAFGTRPNFKGRSYDNVFDIRNEFRQLSQFMREFEWRFGPDRVDREREFKGVANGDNS